MTTVSGNVARTNFGSRQHEVRAMNQSPGDANKRAEVEAQTVRTQVGLYDGFEAYRTPTEVDYRRLLTSGLVVPDTNVFLNLYRYNDETRTDCSLS